MPIESVSVPTSLSGQGAEGEGGDGHAGADAEPTAVRPARALLPACKSWPSLLRGRRRLSLRAAGDRGAAAARRRGSRSPRPRGGAGAGRDGLSSVAIRRLPGSRDGRRPVPRLCEPATAAPCRLGLPRLEQRPGRNGRSAGAKRGGQRRPRLKPSFPRRAGCAEIRHDKGRDGQEEPGRARPRRTAPLDVPRNGPADGRGCSSGRLRSIPPGVASPSRDRGRGLGTPAARSPDLSLSAPAGPYSISPSEPVSPPRPELMAKTPAADTSG